jgi:hypothetical protein
MKNIYFFSLFFSSIDSTMLLEKNNGIVHIQIILHNFKYETRAIPDPFAHQFIKDAAINITYSMGTSQRILYFNYPRLNNTTPDNLKTDIAGIIILGHNSNPIGYFTTQANQTGWQIASQDLVPTKISLIDDNLYVGRNSGPSNAPHTKKSCISNIVVGNNCYPFDNISYMSFNTVFGNNNDDRLTGSYNTIIGSNNAKISPLIDKNEGSNALANDIISSDNLYNYNIVIGHKSFGIDSTFNIPKAPNKQNICIGNLTAQGMLGALRNIIMGNNILVSIAGIQVPFYNFQNNIIIGNDILVDQDRIAQNNFNNNIFIVGKGNGTTNNFLSDNQYSIFIGTSGNKDQKSRSYQTYIGNIYGDLFLEIDDNQEIQGIQVPQSVWINHEYRLGSIMIPYKELSQYIISAPEDSTLDTIVTSELFAIPVVSIQPSDQSMKLFGVNALLIKEDPNTFKNLGAFLLRESNNKTGSIVGYEHMHLVPLLIRGFQMLWQKNETLQNKHNTIKNILLSLATNITNTNSIDPATFAHALSNIAHAL